MLFRSRIINFLLFYSWIIFSYISRISGSESRESVDWHSEEDWSLWVLVLQSEGVGSWVAAAGGLSGAAGVVESFPAVVDSWISWFTSSSSALSGWV